MLVRRVHGTSIILFHTCRRALSIVNARWHGLANKSPQLLDAGGRCAAGARYEHGVRAPNSRVALQFSTRELPSEPCTVPW